MMSNPIESSQDCSWLTERWATGLRMNDDKYWSNLADHLHCCAMALWELNSTQRFEYLELAALADTYSITLMKERSAQ